VGLGNASFDHQLPSNLGRPRNFSILRQFADNRCARLYYNARVHFVYMVRCADDSFYTGYARDPIARERVHNQGRGAKYTASRRPVALVFVQKFRTRSAALRRECQLKQWTRAEKAALVRTAESPLKPANISSR
jgi:putative endonuclease